jgi:hypothetical protein
MGVFRREFVEALSLLARACEEVVRQGYPRPILVGGGAVEFHTRGAIASGDFDFVTPEHEAFENVLPKYGFVEEKRPGRLMRSFYHPALGLAAEVISGSLYDGRSEVDRIRLVEIIEGQRVAVPPVEDLIADRLGQHTEDGRRAMLEQAVAMYKLAFELDEAYLDRRIRLETHGDHDLAFLQEQAK